MGSDDAVKREEPGPDDMKRWLGDTPEEDTEGHKRDAGPDEAWRLSATPDDKDTEGHKRDAEPDGASEDGKGDAPGPDETRFSDRNLKVGIVPVEW